MSNTGTHHAAAPAIVRPSVVRTSIKAERVAVALGAELSNVNLADAGKDADQIKEIRALLLQHKVLFFRDQDISPMEHQTFAEQFGELDIHALLPMHPEAPKILPLHHNYKKGDQHSYENVWHADTTYLEKPHMGSVLRCLVCPELGGDTLWANMGLAYEKLPAQIKKDIEGLYAKHSIEHTFASVRPIAERRAIGLRYPPAEHPVVRTHPETDEKILFVCPFTSHFANYHNFDRVRVGQDFLPEANHLMNYLISQAAIPEYQVRLRWKPNTVAFWDNRATQHYAVYDYAGQPRSMDRAAILDTERPS